MKKFFVKSLGCKTNQLEGQIIAQNLVAAGFKRASAAEADYYILNSCTVTASADSQVSYLLNKAKRENPCVKTVLAGCIVQAGCELQADFVLNNQEKLEISKYLLGENAAVVDFPFLEKSTSTRVSIKIQDGCNNSCAYCIIPKARGRSRSNGAEKITEQIEYVAKLGHKEIVLTGIHIGQWGLEWGRNLLDLLTEIEKTSIHRYRLGSLYVNEITDEIIEFLRKSEKFCPHFHLSLQSLSDSVLNGMGRNYSVEEAFILVEKLHKNFKLPFLGCDIIAGFPNESEADFLETYSNLKALRLTKIHAFPYSRRKGTPADKMTGQLPEAVKKERTKRLIALSNELYSDFIGQNLGSEVEVIYENKSSKSGLYKGVSRNYIDVFVESEQNLKGQIQKIELRKNFLLV